MIRINGDVVVNKFVSIPQDLREGGLNTAAFVAGVVNGVLDAAEFVRVLLFLLMSGTCSCKVSFSKISALRYRRTL